MMNFKIMNVLLSDAPQFLGSPKMLCSSDRPVRRDTDDHSAWLLEGPGSHDFTTFFNAISVAKWKLYTVARDFRLHLELKGAACTVTQTRADSLSWYSERVEGTSTKVSASTTWQTVELKLTADDSDVIEGFVIDCEGDVSLRNSYYYVVVDEKDLRPVELALCTTTFKKEEFIKRNIGLVRREILGCPDLISHHFTMHVVDNGRSLEADVLSGQGIEVHPNDNAGGAGGFAAGGPVHCPSGGHPLSPDRSGL